MGAMPRSYQATPAGPLRVAGRKTGHGHKSNEWLSEPTTPPNHDTERSGVGRRRLGVLDVDSVAQAVTARSASSIRVSVVGSV